MDLPIDTHAVSFQGAGRPTALTDFNTKQPKAGADGQILYSVPVVVFGDEDADVIAVRVAGEPKGVTKGVPLKIVGLVASPWTMNDRSGITYRAESIEVLVPARASS